MAETHPTNSAVPTYLTLLLRYANLISAARATLHAEQDGEPDPTWYLRDELDATGQLPADVDATLRPTNRAQL